MGSPKTSKYKKSNEMTKIVFNGGNRKNSSHFNDNMMMVNPDFSNMGYSPIK